MALRDPLTLTRPCKTIRGKRAAVRFAIWMSTFCIDGAGRRPSLHEDSTRMMIGAESAPLDATPYFLSHEDTSASLPGHLPIGPFLRDRPRATGDCRVPGPGA